MNTMTKPWWNGPEMRCGKNCLPVRVCWFAGDSLSNVPLGASRCWIGFTPSSDENSDDVGGRPATWWATW
jgi:hypothetical protein